MKALMTILIILLACPHLCKGQERNNLEIDIASAIIYGRVHISVEHAFSEKWSVKADASIGLGRHSKLADDEELTHWNKLYGDNFVHFRHDNGQTFENGFSFRFWPKTLYNGPVISLGGIIGGNGIPDMTAGIGYNCPIWKGIHAAIMCSAGLKDCINNGFKLSEGLRIGLSYVF